MFNSDHTYIKSLKLIFEGKIQTVYHRELWDDSLQGPSVLYLGSMQVQSLNCKLYKHM